MEAGTRVATLFRCPDGPRVVLGVVLEVQADSCNVAVPNVALQGGPVQSTDSGVQYVVVSLPTVNLRQDSMMGRLEVASYAGIVAENPVRTHTHKVTRYYAQVALRFYAKVYHSL